MIDSKAAEGKIQDKSNIFVMPKVMKNIENKTKINKY